MKEEVSENPDGPEFEVWNHLWSGVDMAAQELRALDPKWRSTVEKIGKIIVSARTGLSQQAATVEADILSLEDDLLEDPWIRHAAEIEIAGDAMGKAEVAQNGISKSGRRLHRESTSRRFRRAVG